MATQIELEESFAKINGKTRKRKVLWAVSAAVWLGLSILPVFGLFK